MIKRTVRKGGNAGGEFWGSPNFRLAKVSGNWDGLRNIRRLPGCR